MDFIHGELNQRQVEYRRAMMAAAERYPVRFLDGPVFYPGRAPSLTHTSDGPFGVAGDLMGQTELFAAVLEKPAFVAELLRIVTDKLIAYLDFCWTEEGLADRDLSWTDDLAAGLSAESYRAARAAPGEEAAVPFRRRASLHMCGRTDHLLEIFRDELAINEYQGFGYQVDAGKVAAGHGRQGRAAGKREPHARACRGPRNGYGKPPGRASRSLPRSAATSSRTAQTSRREHRPSTSTR